MALTMRPSVYKDKVDYSIFCGEWCIGRIMRPARAPVPLRWFWALHLLGKPPGLAHRQPRGDAGPGQGRVRGELEAVEGAGGDGGSRLTSRA